MINNIKKPKIKNRNILFPTTVYLFIIFNIHVLVDICSAIRNLKKNKCVSVLVFVCQIHVTNVKSIRALEATMHLGCVLWFLCQLEICISSKFHNY